MFTEISSSRAATCAARASRKPAFASLARIFAVTLALATTIAPVAFAAAPGISAGTPNPYADVGVLWTFGFYAWDHDGDKLVYSVKNRPSWLTLSSSDGRLRGTPSASHAGVYRDIVVSVSDGTSTSSLAPFSITVRNPDGTLPDTGGSTPPPPSSTDPDNRAPSISGSPPTSISVGDLYTFLPYAWDNDNDPITFSIQNKPAWLSIDRYTGRVRGTPTAADAGTYSNVKITVSDGQATSSLPAYTLTVLQSGAAAGAVALSWTPPTRNTDGSTLTNLAGYRIRYGTNSSSLSRTISITNPGVSSYVVDDLASGTWYFAVTAVNSKNVESQLSTVVSKRI